MSRVVYLSVGSTPGSKQSTMNCESSIGPQQLTNGRGSLWANQPYFVLALDEAATRP